MSALVELLVEGRGRKLPEFEIFTRPGFEVPEEMQQEAAGQARVEADRPAAGTCLAIH